MKTDLRWISTTNPQFWRCVLPARYTLDEFHREFDRATAIIHALPPGHRFVYLVDMSQVQQSDPRNRQRVAQFLKDCDAALRRHMIAWGFVAKNQLTQGVLTAISWLGSFPVPTRVFTSVSECEHWLEQQLALDQLGPGFKR